MPAQTVPRREVIPASPGPLTLYYPKWIPGEHGPTGPIINLAGLKFTAGAKTLAVRAAKTSKEPMQLLINTRVH
jgi:hypothetical protein